MLLILNLKSFSVVYVRAVDDYLKIAKIIQWESYYVVDII